MINFFRKHVSLPKGATTLVIATMLLIAATLVVLFGASYSILQQRITSNQYRNNQAFEAAQAGLEFGIAYLKQNRTAITGSPVNGYIPNYTSVSTTNVALANGSTFSILYTNPIMNNYNLIQITSTGTSADGTAVRVVTQQVQYSSLLYAPGQRSVVSKGNFLMAGNTIVTNTAFNTTIQTGGTTTLTGTSKTVLSTGTSSTFGNIKSDISQANIGLAGMTTSDFFSRFFGATSGYISNKFINVFTNNSSTNYNSVVNGLTGTTIWINQVAGTATIDGFTTVGSSASPVLMVVNGDLTLAGNATIYGFIFSVGGSNNSTNVTGNAIIVGGLATNSNLTTNNNVSITFNSSVESNIQNSASAGYFAKVPGTWKDF